MLPFTTRLEVLNGGLAIFCLVPFDPLVRFRNREQAWFQIRFEEIDVIIIEDIMFVNGTCQTTVAASYDITPKSICVTGGACPTSGD